MTYTPTNWQTGPTGGTPVNVTRLDNMESGISGLDTRVTALESGGSGSGSNPFGSVFRTLASFTGTDATSRLRNAATVLAGANPMPIVLIPPNTTIDSGANNPIILPSYFHMMCVPVASTDEFGLESTVNVRHTGSTTTLGVFKWADGSSSQKFSGITFKGTSTTRFLVDVATDGSSANTPSYLVYTGVSFNQFESVQWTTGTGLTWHGGAYLNNMAAGREPLMWAGSDHSLWSNGGFFEMGNVGTYATKVSCPAMFHGGSLSNTAIGSVYWTGSPTTPVRLDGGTGGVHFTQAVLEGRPAPGTTVDASNNVTGGLHCAGPLARLTGGRATFLNREHGYAMRDPNPTSGSFGYQPGGFYHVSGGDHTIFGGTWTPFTAATYSKAWTMPNGVVRAAGTLPPFAWVTGSTTRLYVGGIQRGNNATSIPQVYVPAATPGNVVTDGTVQVVTY